MQGSPAFSAQLPGLLWVPSHKGIPGNTKVYAVAKSAAKRPRISLLPITPPRSGNNPRHTSNNQYGLRKGRGAEDAIDRFYRKRTKCLDNEEKCTVVFQNLTKTLDLVICKKLLEKLKKAGCRGKVLKWFNSYLTRRIQRVRIGSTLSNFLEIEMSSLRQGTALSPLIFLFIIQNIEK